MQFTAPEIVFAISLLLVLFSLFNKSYAEIKIVCSIILFSIFISLVVRNHSPIFQNTSTSNKYGLIVEQNGEKEMNHWLVIEQSGGKVMRHWLMPKAPIFNGSVIELRTKKGKVYISTEVTSILISDSWEHFSKTYKYKYSIPEEQIALE